MMACKWRITNGDLYMLTYRYMANVTYLIGVCTLLLAAGCVNTSEERLNVSKPPSAWVDACKDWDDWSKPAPPFQIYGNSYYVGTCGITSVLITGSEGHILIDGATEAGADVIVDNIHTLGFSIKDVRRLLHSHEHFDHVAGLAKLQKLSGAKLLASAEAAPALRTGKAIDEDPQAGMMHEPFPVSRVDGIVTDGEGVVLGDLLLMPLATPGHTPGALSWQWTSCVDEQCLPIVFADSLSAVSHEEYYFSDHEEYVDSYKKGIEKLASLDCQIIVSSHPSSSKMRDRLLSPEGLVDSRACETYAAKALRFLEKRLLKEQLVKAGRVKS